MLRRNADLLHDKIEMKYLQEIMSEENLESFNKKFISFKGEVLSLIGATVKFKENIGIFQNVMAFNYSPKCIIKK